MIRHAMVAGGITNKGRHDATMIGKGLRALLSGELEVFSSKVDRAKQTAELAFDQKYEIAPWLREQCKDNLMDHLKQAHKGNQIFVTHSTCMGALKSNQGDYLIPFNPGGSEDYGLAVFMERPISGGEPNLIGCAWPEDWKKIR